MSGSPGDPTRPTIHDPRSTVVAYHDRTKHHFHRFAPSMGYLDWATQPNPFRRYDSAPLVELPRRAVATEVAYEQLYEAVVPAPLTQETLGEFLRCSLGLSAWKQYGTSRWALRVNPSSGNLHPTEAYVVTHLPRLAVYHYAPGAHLLEERAVLDGAACPQLTNAFLVGLTSIYWRESWKYGERAFRYCQHDLGHAIAALRLAAAMLGWHMALLPRWSDDAIAGLLGLPDHEESDGPEREAPECVAVVTAEDVAPWLDIDPAPLVDAAARSHWQGSPNRLSPRRIEWPVIDGVAEVTRFPGVDISNPKSQNPSPNREDRNPKSQIPDPSTEAPRTYQEPGTRHQALSAREVILRRRSALAFDGRGSLPKAVLASILNRLVPESRATSAMPVRCGSRPPWDAIWWPPYVHLVLFVHRVEDLLPGVYAFLRTAGAGDELRAAMRREFLWESIADVPGLFLLLPLDCRGLAKRVSCDQDIASDGFLGLAMLAQFDNALRSHGPWIYRHLFWECGAIGQVLYLEAEAAGARATGIGCFYDDPVHELLGLSGHGWQSLYHFSMGMPVDDTRLTTELGYPWD